MRHLPFGLGILPPVEVNPQGLFRPSLVGLESLVSVGRCVGRTWGVLVVAAAPEPPAAQFDQPRRDEMANADMDRRFGLAVEVLLDGLEQRLSAPRQPRARGARKETSTPVRTRRKATAHAAGRNTPPGARLPDRSTPTASCT